MAKDDINKVLSPASKQEEAIFNNMLSLYDDAEKIVLTLKEAGDFDRIKNFEKMEQLLLMLDNSVQSLIDAYVSFVEDADDKEISAKNESNGKSVVSGQMKDSLADIVKTLAETRAKYPEKM